MKFEVRFSQRAGSHLDALIEHLLMLARTGADFQRVKAAKVILLKQCRLKLADMPTKYRRAGADPLLPELVLSTGSRGYVALFRIYPATSIVVVLAVRDDRQQDYPA